MDNYIDCCNICGSPCIVRYNGEASGRIEEYFDWKCSREECDNSIPEVHHAENRPKWIIEEKEALIVRRRWKIDSI